MNEIELRNLFIQSVQSGHILPINDDRGNSGLSHLLFPFTDPTSNSPFEIRIKTEGIFRKFDLVIAIIKRRNSSNVKVDSVEKYDHYQNILVRTKLIGSFASKNDCRIDWIHFYPVEIKSDSDKLDHRLRDQILSAIITFGRSILVLDVQHAKNARRSHMYKLLPTTVLGYTGDMDYFEIISTYDNSAIYSNFEVQNRRIAKILHCYGIKYKGTNVQRCLSMMQRLQQKVLFSHLYDSNEIFTSDEIDFISKLSDVRITTDKKVLDRLVGQSTNKKITDYF